MGTYPQFKDPPRTTRPGDIPWMDVLGPLTEKGKHGEWALVWNFSSSGGATNAMKRLRERKVLIPEPEGAWEFTTRKSGEKGRDLYARFRPKKRSTKR